MIKYLDFGLPVFGGDDPRRAGQGDSLGAVVGQEGFADSLVDFFVYFYGVVFEKLGNGANFHDEGHRFVYATAAGEGDIVGFYGDGAKTCILKEPLYARFVSQGEGAGCARGRLFGKFDVLRGGHHGDGDPWVFFDSSPADES